MIATRGTAGRTALALAQQAGLSILGTLAATAILAGVKAEWPMRPVASTVAQAPAPALPQVTSGGKFAARAAGGDDPEPFVTMSTLPALLPMFTAPAVPALDFVSPPTALADVTMVEEPQPIPPKPPRMAAAVRHDLRHTTATAPVAQHRGPTGTIAMAALPKNVEVRDEDPSFWSRSQTAVRQVASWSGTLVDHLLP